MRRTTALGHVGNQFVEKQLPERPVGTRMSADFMNDIQEDLMGIQEAYSIPAAPGTEGALLAALKKMATEISIQYSKPVAELFQLPHYRAPAAFDPAHPENYFPAICVNSDTSQAIEISSLNYPDLVPVLREQALTNAGNTHIAASGWSVVSGIATLTLSPTQIGIINTLLEDVLAQGSQSNRCIVLPTAIGTIPAGEYSLAGNVSSASRSIEFPVSAPDGSGTTTAYVEIYPFRVPNQSDRARFITAESLILSTRPPINNVGGMLHRERFEGYTSNLQYLRTIGTYLYLWTGRYIP